MRQFLPGTSPLLLVLGALLAAPAPASAQQEKRVPVQPHSTFTIVARDPVSGNLGVATSSHWFSVGSSVPWAEAGVGAVATQSFSRLAYGPELLDDMRAGKNPQEALDARVTLDTGRDVRQVIAIDSQGRTAAYTGGRCIAAAAHRAGDGYVIAGNIMENEGVADAMAEGYENAKGSFPERLLAALEGAERAGGDLRGRQSSAILVVSGQKQDQPWMGRVLDLRVEDHHRPVDELGRLLRIHRAYDEANLGDEAVAQGHIDEAVVHYQRAEELYPEQVELSFWRAANLLESGYQKEAFLLFQHVFAEEPAWSQMPPRLVAAGHLKADPEMLAKIAALAPEATPSELLPQPDARHIEHDVRTLVGFGTRHTLSDARDPQRGIGAARRWIETEFKLISHEYHDRRLQVEAMKFHIPPGRRLPDGADLVDVVATLPGTDPNRLIVISGHYDSRAGNGMDAESDAPGADDDASGVAAVLEAARVLGGVHPRASLVFVAFAGEEQGLYGSQALARRWKEEGKQVVGIFNLDIVGGVLGSSGKYEPWRLRVFSEGMPSLGPKVVGSNEDAPARELARYLERTGEATVPGFDLTLVFRPDRFLRGGDQKPFSELGWPAVRLSEPPENYHWQHQDVRTENGIRFGDLPEFLDYDFVARVAHAAASAMHELALAPPEPGNVLMDVSSLTPDTTLIWDPSEDPQVAGYAVLYRRTHEPTWTHRRIVGTDHRVTLEGLSKDDWLFAVESFDAENHRSLPVFPRPRF